MLTYTWCNGRSALLVAFGTSVTREACHSIFAWALTAGLVANGTQGANWMAITCWKKMKKIRKCDVIGWCSSFKKAFPVDNIISTHVLYMKRDQASLVVNRHSLEVHNVRVQNISHKFTCLRK